jgi:crotonobetainyl-CoA:carnitine CoA-transferase CaiB-like acyl-CoA transferase
MKPLSGQRVIDRLFEKLTQALGEPDLASDPRFAGNAARVLHRDLLTASASLPST